MVMVSRRFAERIRLHSEPAYKLAWRSGIHPSTLSKLIHGAALVHLNDPRIIAVGRELGLTPEECFADETPATPASTSQAAHAS